MKDGKQVKGHDFGVPLGMIMGYCPPTSTEIRLRTRNGTLIPLSFKGTNVTQSDS